MLHCQANDIASHTAQNELQHLGYYIVMFNYIAIKVKKKKYLFD